MKLYIDPGHGGSDPGAVGNGLQEKDIVLDIALKLRSILTNEYSGVKIKMSRTDDKTVSLSQRTSEANAWKADFFISIHTNAANSVAQGYEDFIYTGLSSTSQSAKIQNIIHPEIVSINQLKNRGKKKGNFHVLRETKMSALLTENGFIDHPDDASKMKNNAWRDAVARGHAEGIAKAFGLPKKEDPQPNPMFDLALIGSDKAILSSSDPRRHAGKVEELLRDQVDGVQVVKRI